MTPRFVLVGLAIGSVAVAAQTAPPKLPPPEAVQVAVGWSALADGNAARGATVGAAVVQQFPRNAAAASLYVQAEIARGGAQAGLAAYEQWLGGRHVEDPYVLRQVALAALREVVTNTTLPGMQREAFIALADEGDAVTMADVRRNAAADGVVETQILARQGNEDAVKKLIAQVRARSGVKEQLITALAETGSRLAVPLMLELLYDSNDVNRAAAANALGVLHATEAIPRIRPLLDEKEPLYLRLSAAGALFRLNDLTGLPLLREKENSEYPHVSLGALRITSSQPDAAWQAAVRSLALNSDPDVRRQAADLIAPYDPDLARSVLEELSTNGNVAIREEAARIYLEKVASDFTGLRRFLHSSDGVVRVRAATRILGLTR